MATAGAPSAKNAPSHMEAGTTWYYNGADSQGLSYEKTILANGTTEHKHYVNAGGVTFALYVQREGNLNGKPATSTSYFHHDHLGSIAAVSNAAGVVVERMAYDPWGKRRFSNGTNDRLDALYGVSTDRGYTMHEHLDEMGIIHMNGRVYDPLNGRFMSADPHIQFANNLQSYNRYSYVLNNPLSYTDPSGYFLKKLFKNKAFRIIASIAVAAVIGDWTGQSVMWAMASTSSNAAAIGAIAGGAAGGFAAGVVGSGGDLKAGLQGALTGGLFGAAGTVGGMNDPSRYLAHAGAGCVSAVAGSGKCGQGAASAVFGKFTSNALGGLNENAPISEVVGKGVATAVAGGVGSVIAGGKFANGAETAAYGYLFNQISQRRGCTASNYMSCAMGDRESDEWKAADQKIKSGAAVIADATDKGATGAAMACVAVGNAPCAGAATGVSVVAKGVSYALNPPGPREFFLDTASMISGPAIDRLATMMPLTWFMTQTSVTLGAELMKSHAKSADEAASRK